MQKILNKVFTRCSCDRAKDYCGMQCEHVITGEFLKKLGEVPPPSGKTLGRGNGENK
jgi:hypothetical protein